MAILIEGMEMPAMCSECDFCGGLILPDNIYTCDCPSEKIHGKNITRAIEEDCRHPNCPLIEVPEPHGRLIDADKLKETLDYYISEAGWSDEINKALSWVKDEFIDSEQAVISASEGG